MADALREEDSFLLSLDLEKVFLPFLMAEDDDDLDFGGLTRLRVSFLMMANTNSYSASTS
mgnify:CR=1 FL=1